jgi:hypothetical protein
MQGPRPVSVKLMSKPSTIVLKAFYCPALCRVLKSGETRIRTGDTMIFSYVSKGYGRFSTLQQVLT